MEPTIISKGGYSAFQVDVLWRIQTELSGFHDSVKHLNLLINILSVSDKLLNRFLPIKLVIFYFTISPLSIEKTTVILQYLKSTLSSKQLDSVVLRRDTHFTSASQGVLGHGVILRPEKPHHQVTQLDGHDLFLSNSPFFPQEKNSLKTINLLFILNKRTL